MNGFLRRYRLLWSTVEIVTIKRLLYNEPPTIEMSPYLYTYGRAFRGIYNIYYYDYASCPLRPQWHEAVF